MKEIVGVKMEKDLRVIDIGNHVWCGELTVGRDAAGEPVIEKFYGLSEGSVRTKVAEYRAAHRKKRALHVNGASDEHAAAVESAVPAALAVNAAVSDSADIGAEGAVKGHAAPAVLAADGGADWTAESAGCNGGSAAPEKAAVSVDLDMSGPCKVIPIRGSGEITYVVDGDAPEDELDEDEEMRLSGRVADVIILKYADIEYDRVNDRPKRRGCANLKPDWERIAQDAAAEKAPHGDMTVTDMCGRWLEERARRGASEREIHRKKNVCMFYILPVMGDALCRDVDRRHVERAAIRMLYRKDNSDKYGKRDFMAKGTTIKIKLGIMNDLLEYGWSNGCLPFRLRVQVNVREV